MAKILKATFEKNCIGCELCVLDAQRQMKKVGLEGSPIRIFREKKSKDLLTFSVDLDPSVNELDVQKIKDICPALVFTLEDKKEESHELAE